MTKMMIIMVTKEREGEGQMLNSHILIEIVRNLGKHKYIIVYMKLISLLPIPAPPPYCPPS